MPDFPRVRFAPSPTGFLHVGSARTFIFNWLYARHNNGAMILRVDDTDVERNTDASLTSIFEGLQWLNLNWDEQYKQSERLNLHRQMADAILKKGLAYRDFTPAHAGDSDRSTQTKIDPKDLRIDTYRASSDSEASTAVRITHIPTGTIVTSDDENSQSKNREKAMRLLSSKLSERVQSTWLFNPGMRDLPQSQSDARAAAGEPFALRFRVPREADREIRFTDAVYGDQFKSTADIEDFALLRSDGMPTYHLASCADDADLRITHVIRGQDHLTNTFKHILIFDAAGAPLPQFAHLPLLVAPDGTKLSKRRHGPVVSVTTYRDAGFLPEAFINFLCLLGWSPKNDREQMTGQELVESFTLEAINRSNAVVNFKEKESVERAPSPAAVAVDLPYAAADPTLYPEETFDPKALWLNAEHIRSLPVDALSARLLPIVRAAGHHIDPNKMHRITPLIRERIKLLRDVLTAADFFFVDELPPYDPTELIPQKGDATLALKVLNRARDLLAQAQFTHDSLDSTLRAAAQELGIKPGQMFQPIRVAVCGRKNAPPLFETLEVLGRETTLARIDKAIARLQ